MDFAETIRTEISKALMGLPIVGKLYEVDQALENLRLKGDLLN